MSHYLPPPGVRARLIEFASGGRTVQGAMFEPEGEARRIPGAAMIFVHGVESFWYAGPSMFLSTALAGRGLTTIAYNGAHCGPGFRLSTFEAATREVGDVIAFARGLGFTRIYLAGHSLGTPIVMHYAGDDPDPAVAAVGVYGPHVSIPEVTRDSLLGPELYNRFREECRALVAAGKGDDIRLLPYRESRVIVTSAKTFLSYRDVDGSRASVGAMIARIGTPLFIVYDDADNIQGMGAITARSAIARRIADAARAAPAVDTAIIPSLPGNSPVQAHSFVGNEPVVVEATWNWLRRRVFANT